METEGITENFPHPKNPHSTIQGLLFILLYLKELDHLKTLRRSPLGSRRGATHFMGLNTSNRRPFVAFFSWIFFFPGSRALLQMDDDGVWQWGSHKTSNLNVHLSDLMGESQCADC